MTRDSLPIQGQSDSTEAKERGLQAVFAVNLRIFKRKWGDRYPYWHWDMNCGSGINEDAGCIGSPIAFLRAAAAEGIDRYFAGFCDLDSARLAALLGRAEVAGNPRAFLFHGHNASLVEAIPDLIAGSPYRDRPSMACGMVLSDPNGDAVPIDELANLAVACPRLDFAIHWNSRLRWLRRGHGHAFNDIEESIARLGKSHWLIRKPLGDWYWTVLIGRNTRVNDHRALGFYHLESDEGQAILRKCKAGAPKPPRPRLADVQMEFAL